MKEKVLEIIEIVEKLRSIMVQTTQVYQKQRLSKLYLGRSGQTKNRNRGRREMVLNHGRRGDTRKTRNMSDCFFIS